MKTRDGRDVKYGDVLWISPYEGGRVSTIGGKQVYVHSLKELDVELGWWRAYECYASRFNAISAALEINREEQERLKELMTMVINEDFNAASK